MSGLGNILGTVAGAVTPGGPLLSILVKAGVPILADLVQSQSPAAGQVVKTIADALGVEPTEAAIAEKHAADPEATEEAIRQVEAASPEFWAYLANADRLRNEIFAQEAKEPWWAWAWRPFWMWLLAVYWTWLIMVVPLVNLLAPHPIVLLVEIGTLLTLTGLYLGLYMGGHTIKDGIAKFTGAAK